jgi:dolichol-phosphate mannosyltransferase
VKRVSIIAPLYNEKDGIPMLAETLSLVAIQLAPNYEVEFVLVDDGSRDGTSQENVKYFARFPKAIHARHDRNRGLGAAVRTGFAHATGDVVCTIDADCTFDPLHLPGMLEVMEREGTDIVTGSPYHPQGGVENVGLGRLLLSRGASVLYRRLSVCKLYSYTSLMRAYRRQVVETVPFTCDGFAATTELLLRAAHKGYTVSEVPMVLKSRAIGASKIKIIRTIRTHLELMVRAVCWRAFDRGSELVVTSHKRKGKFDF